MRLLIFILLFAATAFSQIPAMEPGVSQELAKWRASQYSNISYKLNLTLEKMSPVLRGSMEIHVNVEGEKGRKGEGESEPGAIATGFLTPVILDWRKIPGHEKDSTISNVTINGTPLFGTSGGNSFVLDKGKQALVYVDDYEHLIFSDGVQMGENVIKLDFTSPILTSGSAITRYVDKEDGAEYIYSLFVPSDASTAFPVFDQPDLKARFTLTVTMPKSWSSVVSNSELEGSLIIDGYCGLPNKGPNFASILGNTSPSPTPTPAVPCELGDVWGFKETKPISTYVFAFAAGPFEAFADNGSVPPAVAGGLSRNITNSTGPSVANSASSTLNVQPPATAGGTDKTAEPSTSIFVRKSQAEKFKPHAAEVFRLNREAVKYLETYFDYKFPFPKYDLVLIPEFPFGGMEHAGATFLREQSVIFPQEPTKNDIISRANLIFHETAHQWFGDTVTMKWFDDLWLKEGFAEFMAYKTLEKVMPDANAWKVFFERNKQAAYATDSTKGTTPIYQPIANLNSAKSAYGNIVYRKAPSFLRQAEFYLGEDKFQTAVRAFLKKHEFANAGWEDLVTEFANASWRSFADSNRNPVEEELRVRKAIMAWADTWVKKRGVSKVRLKYLRSTLNEQFSSPNTSTRLPSEEVYTRNYQISQSHVLGDKTLFGQRFRASEIYSKGRTQLGIFSTSGTERSETFHETAIASINSAMPDFRDLPIAVIPNAKDYGYGIFLLDDKSRDYVLKNIGREKDDFLRTMMWGSLWDSVREAELAPKDYVELVIKNIGSEKDEGTIQTLLGRVSTAMNYYVSVPPAVAGGLTPQTRNANKQSSRQSTAANNQLQPPAIAGGTDLLSLLEDLLIDKIQNASTQGQRITYYRAFLNIASTDKAREILKQILGNAAVPAAVRVASRRPDGSAGRTPDSQRDAGVTLRTKDKFDIVTRLTILGDMDAPKLLADLEKTETSDDAKRYAYAAHAAFGTAENKAKFFNDFLSKKDISESWIEAAFGPFNVVRHNELTLPYLNKALAELPNLKHSRKIFFVNGWLSAFIGGQRDEKALAIINKFLADNPNLDNDLRLKILENSDLIERAIKIRTKYKN